MPRSRKSPRAQEPVFWRSAGLPFEGRRAFDSDACYRAHTHPTLSIGIVDAGTSVLTLSADSIHLSAGDVVVIYPGEVHACNPKPNERWSYRMFYLESEWAHRVAAGPRAKSQTRPFLRHIRDGRAMQVLNEMTDAFAQPLRPGARLVEVARCLRSLARLCERANSAEPGEHPRGPSPEIEYARREIERNAEAALPLAKLARIAGLSPFTFLRRFKTEVGLTPHAYQLDQRINRARQLLKTARDAADVAYSLGFSDQSHFQRVFKKRVAATPGQYASNR